MSEQQVQIGLVVTYYPVIDDKGVKHDPFKTTVRSMPWKLGSGELVCLVNGKTGGVSLKHLELR